MLKSSLAALALVLSVSLAPARGEKCPARSLQLDDIVVALKTASGCQRALKIFQYCEFGTSGDVQLGAVVEKKCEADFLDRLTTSQKQAYQREMRRCDRKYQNEPGSMYRSFTAFCRAEIARHYSHQVVQGAGPSRAR